MSLLDEPRRFPPAERVLLAYLLLTLPLFLFVPATAGPVLRTALVHVGAIAAFVVLRRAGAARNRWGRLLLDVLPVALFGFLYGEVAILNRAFHPDRYFDPEILRIEGALFGGQPAVTWRQALPWAPLAEYLHLAYFSYYTYVPALLVTLWFTRGRRVYHRALAHLALTFTAGFVLFILIPVRGPYYELPRPDPATLGYLFPRITHWIIDRGSSVGTAFPSSHVSVAFTAWFLAMRHQKRLAIVLAFFVPAMAIGTVYGGFHYLVDVLGGLAIAGLVIAFAGKPIDRALDGQRG